MRFEEQREIAMPHKSNAFHSPFSSFLSFFFFASCKYADRVAIRPSTIIRKKIPIITLATCVYAAYVIDIPPIRSIYIYAFRGTDTFERDTIREGIRAYMK